MLFMMPSSFGAGTSPTWESTIGLALSIAFVGSAMADGATIPATSSAAVTANFRIALPLFSPCQSRWIATAGSFSYQSGQSVKAKAPLHQSAKDPLGLACVLRILARAHVVNTSSHRVSGLSRFGGSATETSTRYGSRRSRWLRRRAERTAQYDQRDQRGLSRPLLRRAARPTAANTTEGSAVAARVLASRSPATLVPGATGPIDSSRLSETGWPRAHCSGD